MATAIQEGDGMTDTYRPWYEDLVEALPKRDQRLLACKIARQALSATGIDDPRLWGAVAVAERYAHGNAAQEELDAAWAAARGASEEADRAAWAAWAASGVSSWDAAWAARAAARAAAWDAAWAARAAARVAAQAVRAAAWDAAWAARHAAGVAAQAVRAAAWDAAWAARHAAGVAAYKMFFEWAMELAVGEHYEATLTG